MSEVDELNRAIAERPRYKCPNCRDKRYFIHEHDHTGRKYKTPCGSCSGD